MVGGCFVDVGCWCSGFNSVVVIYYLYVDVTGIVACLLL